MFEKWRAILASVGGVGGVLASMGCFRRWGACVVGVGGVLAWLVC